MDTAICPHCRAPNAAAAIFCEQCGKALPRATDTGPVFVPDAAVAATETGRSLQAELLRKKASKAATALFAVAILQVIGGALFLALARRGVPAEVYAKVMAFLLGIAFVFTALGFWARSNPLPAAIVGLVLYVSLTLLDLLLAPQTFYQGIIVKLIIIVVLSGAIVAGVQHRKVKAAMDELRDRPPGSDVPTFGG